MRDIVLDLSRVALGDRSVPLHLYPRRNRASRRSSHSMESFSTEHGMLEGYFHVDGSRPPSQENIASPSSLLSVSYIVRLALMLRLGSGESSRELHLRHPGQL